MDSTKQQEGSRMKRRVCQVSLTIVPMHLSSHKWLSKVQALRCFI